MIPDHLRHKASAEERTAGSIKVVVVDDHVLVREGLKRIIAENPGMAVTGEAGDGREALKVIRSEPCDVVLLNISLPQKSGLDVLKEVHAEKPRLPVLILGGYSEDHYAHHVLRAGAAGYLKKESAIAEIIEAIRKVVRGGKYVSQTLAEKVVLNLDSGERPPHGTLSGREHQVLCMIALGKTVSQIGEELALSVKTVSTYRARILEKLKIKNNSEIIRYAIKEGLVD